MAWLPKPSIFSGSNTPFFEGAGSSGTYGALNMEPSMNAGMLRRNTVIHRRNTIPAEAQDESVARGRRTKGYEREGTYQSMRRR